MCDVADVSILRSPCINLASETMSTLITVCSRLFSSILGSDLDGVTCINVYVNMNIFPRASFNSHTDVRLSMLPVELGHELPPSLTRYSLISSFEMLPPHPAVGRSLELTPGRPGHQGVSDNLREVPDVTILRTGMSIGYQSQGCCHAPRTPTRRHAWTWSSTRPRTAYRAGREEDDGREVQDEMDLGEDQRWLAFSNALWLEPRLGRECRPVHRSDLTLLSMSS
ncbi:unnamed protein product [Sphagnum tenellum]